MILLGKLAEARPFVGLGLTVVLGRVCRCLDAWLTVVLCSLLLPCDRNRRIGFGVRGFTLVREL